MDRACDGFVWNVQLSIYDRHLQNQLMDVADTEQELEQSSRPTSGCGQQQASHGSNTLMIDCGEVQPWIQPCTAVTVSPDPVEERRTTNMKNWSKVRLALARHKYNKTPDISYDFKYYEDSHRYIEEYNKVYTYLNIDEVLKTSHNFRSTIYTLTDQQKPQDPGVTLNGLAKQTAVVQSNLTVEPEYTGQQLRKNYSAPGCLTKVGVSSDTGSGRALCIDRCSQCYFTVNGRTMLSSISNERTLCGHRMCTNCNSAQTKTKITKQRDALQYLNTLTHDYQTYERTKIESTSSSFLKPLPKILRL